MNLKEKLYPVTRHFYPILEFTETSTIRNYCEILGTNKSLTIDDSLIYLHIPFCESVCMFCPFHLKVSKDSQVEYEMYVNYLIKEMELLSPKCKFNQIKAIYFGGGSPSVLPAKLVQKLFDALYTNFNIVDSAEISFEGEPRSLQNAELLDVLIKNHVKRVSYGIQTFNRDSREFLKIGATLDDVYRCQTLLREKGFEEINVDMMYYLPGQTINDLINDLNELLILGADSVDYYYMSYYSLPKSYFNKADLGIVPKKPTENVRQDMFRMIRKFFSNTDYKHVMTTFFTKTQCVPEYYRLLWGGANGKGDANTIAIGASSRGYMEKRAYANYTNLSKYYNALDSRILPIESISEIADHVNRGMVFFVNFLQIEICKVPNEYKSKMKLLLENNLIVKDGKYYRITSEGIDWIQNISVLFFTDHQKKMTDKMVEELNAHYSNKVTVYG